MSIDTELLNIVRSLESRIRSLERVELPVAGSGGFAPSSASYITVTANASLTQERVATAGNGITLTDGGANSTLTIATVLGKILLYRNGVVTDYAVSDAGFTAALAAAVAGDSAIFLPPCAISGTWTIPAGVVVIGCSPSYGGVSVLTGTLTVSGTARDLKVVGNVTVGGYAVNLNVQCTSGVGITMASGGVIEDCYVSAGGTQGINVAVSCYVKNCTTSATTSGVGLYVNHANAIIYGGRYGGWTAGAQIENAYLVSNIQAEAASGDGLYHSTGSCRIAASAFVGLSYGVNLVATGCTLTDCSYNSENGVSSGNATFGEGDRGAYDITNSAVRHASDIYNGVLLRHLPAPGTAGNIVRDTGTEWTSQTLAGSGIITGSLTAGRVPVASGATTLVDVSTFTYDTTNHQLALTANASTETPFKITMAASQTANPLELYDSSGNLTHYLTANGGLIIQGSASGIEMWRFANAPGMSANRVNGSLGAESYVTSGQSLGSFRFRTYNGGTWPSYTVVTVAQMAATAAENYSSGNMGTYLAFTSTPIGSGTAATRFVIGSEGNVGVGTNTTPNAKFDVQQNTLGNEVVRLYSTATNDDPRWSVYQNRVATTNATVTTLHTITIDSATSYYIVAHVIGRRTGGASGTANDSAAYRVDALVKDVSGTATIVTTTTTIIGEDQAAWDATIDVTGGTARVRVTGAASNNVTWHLSKLEIMPLSS